MAPTWAGLVVNLEEDGAGIYQTNDQSGSAPSNRQLHNPLYFDDEGKRALLPIGERRYQGEGGSRFPQTLSFPPTLPEVTSFINQMRDCRLTSHSILPQTLPLLPFSL